MNTKRPYGFTAAEKSFTVQLDMPCMISGYRKGDSYASFYRPIPVKKGDTFRAVDGKVVVNGAVVDRVSRPLKKIIWKVSWVAKRLRIAVFQDRDPIWDKRTRKPTKKLGKPHWTACDLRSYHIGCGKTVTEAVNELILHCQADNLSAEEERVKGNSVIRWRCLLPPNEVKEMEAKAKKTGFVLDGVEVPPIPKKWQEGLKRLRKA